MSTINPSDRKTVDDCGAGLVDVSDNVSAKNTVLAGVYDAVGNGIHGSHTAESGVHYLTFELPAHCFVTIEGAATRVMEGPLQLNIVVPGSELFGATPAEQAATLRRNLNAAIGEATAAHDRVE